LEMLATSIEDRPDNTTRFLIIGREEVPAILDFAAHYHPNKNLGGDFYNILEVDDYLIFYVADITGHGLDGAMLNIFVRETVNSFLISEYNDGDNLTPERLMNFITNRYQNESFPEDYFICLVLGVLNLSSRQFKISNAGIHIPPLIKKREGGIDSLTEMTLPISPVIEKENYNFNNIEFKLGTDELLFLSTDGLIEESKGETQYGLSHVKKIIQNNHYHSAREIKNEINLNFNAFRDGTPLDDVTFLIIKHKG
ncbi:MAG: SpoIIE family protein phosphatase, partial [Halanaerobacter sp.]